MRNIFLIIFFLVSISNCYGQSTDTLDFIYRLEKFDSTISEREILDHSSNIKILSNKEQARFYTALGNFYVAIKRDYLKGSLNYYQALEYKEISPYRKADALNGLGAVFSNFLRNDLAVENYRKSLRIVESEFKDSIADITTIYNNIGNAFSRENQQDSAFFIFIKEIRSLKRPESLQMLFTLILDTNMMTSIHLTSTQKKLMIWLLMLMTNKWLLYVC